MTPRKVSSVIALGAIVGLGLYLYLNKRSSPGDSLPKDPIPLPKIKPAIYRATIAYGEIIIIREFDHHEWSMLEGLAALEGKSVEDIILETTFFSS